MLSFWLTILSCVQIPHQWDFLVYTSLIHNCCSVKAGYTPIDAFACICALCIKQIVLLPSTPLSVVVRNNLLSGVIIMSYMIFTIAWQYSFVGLCNRLKKSCIELYISGLVHIIVCIKLQIPKKNIIWSSSISFLLSSFTCQKIMPAFADITHLEFSSLNLERFGYYNWFNQFRLCIQQIHSMVQHHLHQWASYLHSQSNKGLVRCSQQPNLQLTMIVEAPSSNFCIGEVTVYCTITDIGKTYFSMPWGFWIFI